MLAAGRFSCFVLLFVLLLCLLYFIYLVREDPASVLLGLTSEHYRHNRILAGPRTVQYSFKQNANWEGSWSFWVYLFLIYVIERL